MRKKAVVKQVVKRPDLFQGQAVGRLGFKPLSHKDGTPYDDVDYFELLGRKAISMDKENTSKNLPTDYGELDRNTIEVAKQVVKAIDEKMPKKDILNFINMCIDYNG